MSKNKKEEVKNNEEKVIKNSEKDTLENNKKNTKTNKQNTKNSKVEAKVKEQNKKDVKKEKSTESKVDKEVESNKDEKLSQKDKKNLEKKLKKANTEKIVIVSIIIGTLIIAFGLFGFYYYNTNAKPVAKFDGGTVTTADFTVYYKTFAPMLEYYGYPASIIPGQIANKAGIDMIILKQAKEAGVTLSDEDKKKVDDIFADEDQVQQFIVQGIDVARMKQLYYNDYTITAYIEKLKVDAKDEDVIAYIKKNSGDDVDLYEYNTSHILFKTVDDSGNELSEADLASVRSKAEAALARALAGEDFAALAKELSEDTGTKENGGQYVMYMDGNTYTEYADAVKTLEVGKVTTALVKSQAGYHIIKLNDKIENGRAHNDTEREEFVDEDINNLSTTKNLDIDTEYLNKLVEKITGNKVEDETEQTTEDTTSTTTDESSTQTTDTTATAQ